MLVCTIHNKSYVPSLDRWFDIDPAVLPGFEKIITVTEAVCPKCIEYARGSMFIQFPELYVFDNSPY